MTDRYTWQTGDLTNSATAAAEYHAANAALADLQERERKYGPDAVTADQHYQVRRRIEETTKALTIPDRLLRYRDEDWDHPNLLRRRELWRQAQDEWGNAHKIWRADFERLQRIKLKEQGS